jgi:ketosteroid isomerase-like protein
VIDDEAWLAAWDKPDLDAIRSFSADDLEVTAALAAIEPRHYQGRDAAVDWLSELSERIKAGWRATKLTHLDDDVIVVEGRLTFHDPATTGAESQPFAVLMRLRGDEVRWIGTFVTLADAREAFEMGVGG